MICAVMKARSASHTYCSTESEIESLPRCRAAGNFVMESESDPLPKREGTVLLYCIQKRGFDVYSMKKKQGLGRKWEMFI
jgi:hypothetical protein